MYTPPLLLLLACLAFQVTAITWKEYYTLPAFRRPDMKTIGFRESCSNTKLKARTIGKRRDWILVADCKDDKKDKKTIRGMIELDRCIANDNAKMWWMVG